MTRIERLKRFAKSRKGRVVLAGIIVLAALAVAVALRRKPEQPAPIADDKARAIKADSIRRIAQYSIGRRVSYFKVHTNSDLSIDLTLRDLADLEEFAKELQQAKGDPKRASHIAGWSDTLAAKQKECYPILRQDWGLCASRTLWRNNYQVRTPGESHEELLVTGADFASNANIEDFHNQIKPTLERLRFKSATYRWYAGDDGHTYYLPTPPDAAVE